MISLHVQLVFFLAASCLSCFVNEKQKYGEKYTWQLISQHNFFFLFDDTRQFFFTSGYSFFQHFTDGGCLLPCPDHFAFVVYGLLWRGTNRVLAVGRWISEEQLRVPKACNGCSSEQSAASWWSCWPRFILFFSLGHRLRFIL